MVKFIHTADWQIGKPYNRIQDEEKRVRLKDERYKAIERIRDVVTEEEAQFVMVAGDLFDSPTPTKSTVVNTLEKIGQLRVPVYVIPGNHDFGGPGSLWEQPFFLAEKEQLAPNLMVLMEAKPLVLDTAILFPCPLLKRHETSDVLAWLNDETLFSDLPQNLPRIILAHGSVQGFDSESLEEDDFGVANFINLNRLNLSEFDYVALGDWHGTKQINTKSWYSGTHEIDRFPKGDENQPGNILIVEASRKEAPVVAIKRTTGMNWHNMNEVLRSEEDVLAFQEKVYALTANRTNADLLQLTVAGALSLSEWEFYKEVLGAINARLIRVKTYGEIAVAPSEEEVLSLSTGSGNQLAEKVAKKLIEQLDSTNKEEAEVALIALRELYIQLKNQN